jgi:hypothetical protein
MKNILATPIALSVLAGVAGFASAADLMRGAWEISAPVRQSGQLIHSSY